MKKGLAIGFLLLLNILTACHKDAMGGGGNVYSGPNEPSVFTSSPIDVANIRFTLSLGWIQPSGHTIPSDHVYFWYNNPNSNIYLPVYALASGKVTKILNVPVNGIPECKVWFQLNQKFTYYLDHVVLDTSIKEGVMVTAGQKIGTTGYGSSIDLGAIDETLTLNGFANPARYGWETIFCGKPFQYFTEPLRSQIYALVDREGTDKDGQRDIDIPGRLTGNWFLDGTVFYTDSPNGWDKELSFAFDIQHPSVVLVSIGGTLNMMGKWTLQPGAPLPSQVSVANGKIAYPLYSAGGISADPVQRGLMIVQMIDDKHLKVEVFDGLRDKDAAFDSNAKIYAR